MTLNKIAWSKNTGSGTYFVSSNIPFDNKPEVKRVLPATIND